MEGIESGLEGLVTIPILNDLGTIGILSVNIEGKEVEFNKFYLSRKQQIIQYAYAFQEAILAHHADHFGKPYNNLTPFCYLLRLRHRTNL